MINEMGQSQESLKKNKDKSRSGQGVFQGNSSAAPVYNVNLDVSLITYRKLATGVAFTHPITKVIIYAPGVLYPLMASMCTKTELDKIKRVIAQAKCNT